MQVSFEAGSGEALPHPDGSFDVVLSSLVLHHLPHRAQIESMSEIRRVLKPNGRTLIVDIGGAQDETKRTMHARHDGHVGFDLAQVAHHLQDLGLREIEGGPIDSRMPRLERLHYVLATPLREPGVSPWGRTLVP